MIKAIRIAQLEVF